jgi:hypothetical protein
MSDMAPCQFCGVGTDRAVVWVRREASIYNGVPTLPATYRQGTCEECASLDPTTSGYAVRAALRLLGRPEGDWRLASDVYTEHGFDVSRLLYSGTTPQSRPWRHVTGEQRRELKRLHPFVLMAKVEASARPEPVPPPVESIPGLLDRCGICGVAESVNWYGPMSLMGRGGRTTRFVLDDRCADLYQRFGYALGESLYARAFCETAGLTYDDARDYRVRAYLELPEAAQEGVAAPFDWVRVPSSLEPDDAEAITPESLLAQITTLQAELAALRGAES